MTATSFAIEALADPLMLRIFPHALPSRAALSHNLPASLFLFGYTSLCVIAGGYVTAWLAQRSPVRHAVIMGALQMALTVWAMLSLPEQAPFRNWAVAITMSVPAAGCGGLLRSKLASGANRPR